MSPRSNEGGSIAAIELARLLRYVASRHPDLSPRLPAARFVGATDRELWDERVPEVRLFETLEAIARLVRAPAFPIDFASTTRLAHLGLFGLTLRTAPSAQHAVDATMRFQRLFCSSGRIHVERDAEGGSGGELFWRWSRAAPRRLGVRLGNEIALAEQVALVRELIPAARPVVVAFFHPEPEDASAHRRHFGCPIEWSATREGIVWPAAVFAGPLAPSDEGVSLFIRDEAARRLTMLEDAPLLDRARELIAARLSSGDVKLTSLSAALGLSARGLRGALVAEGSSVRILVDEVRRERAKELVEAGRHSLTEVAFALGFSETSAFSRAWRRWFGGSARATRATRAPRRAGL